MEYPGGDSFVVAGILEQSPARRRIVQAARASNQAQFEFYSAVVPRTLSSPASERQTDLVGIRDAFPCPGARFHPAADLHGVSGNDSVDSAENGGTFFLRGGNNPSTHELRFSYLDLSIWEENASRLTTSKKKLITP